jgi:hypothetical protein
MSDVMRSVPWGALAVAVLVAAVWATRRRRTSSTPSATRAALGPRTYEDAIAALTTTASSAAAPDGSVALECGGEPTFLIVAIPDDVVALYLRGGPSMHGAGAIPEIRSAAETFRAILASHRELLRPEPEPSPPEPGWVVLRMRTAGRALAARVPRSAPPSHALADAIRAGIVLQGALLERAK